VKIAAGEARLALAERQGRGAPRRSSSRWRRGEGELVAALTWGAQSREW
jgi:hypothetical protein